MTDIVLNKINSGYNLSKINNNFEVIEDVVNTEVVHTTGGNNTMNQDLDLNSRRILNLPAPINGTEPLRKGDVTSNLTGATIQYVDDSTSAIPLRSNTKYNPSTIQDAIDSTEWDVNGGEVFEAQGYYSAGVGAGKWKTIIAGTTPDVDLPNGVWIRQCVGVPLLAIKLTIKDSMNIESFGASSIVADNSSVIEAALSTDVQELRGNPEEEYTYTSDITSTGKSIKFKNLNLSGENATITLQGELITLGQLTSGGVKNSNIISYGSVAGIEKGDLIIIEDQIPSSFSQHRVSYTDGEFNRVLGTSGTDITTQNALTGVSDYPIAATTKIFKLNPVTVVLDNSKFITRNGTALYALTVKYGENLKLEMSDVKGLENNAGALLLDKCYGIEINGGNYLHDGVNIGLNYGINFSNCQSANVNDCEIYATRHAVTTGGDAQDGSVPCRDIKVNGSYLSNDNTSGVYAADFHGNTANSGYYGCRIDGDIGLGGENIDAIDNVITGRRFNPIIEFQEIVGGVINIKGNKTEIGVGFSFNKIIGFSSSSLSQKVDREFEMNITDISCELNAGVVRIVTVLYNQDNTVKSTLDVRGINVHGDSSGLTEIAQLSRSGAGLNPDHVSITDFKIPASAVNEFVNISGSFTGSTFTLPTQRMPNIPLTIAAAGYESSTGGTGNAGLYVWDYTNYPAVPHLSLDHNGWVRSGDPQFFGAIDSLTNINAQVFLTTASSTITTPTERTITLNAEVTFNNVTI